ncbi:hypothetical protein TRSC58_02145 [Trypanosoma rangeli SC58]|uniref:Uncharacterized protein n=1 Tax=Trypanosoma rangeli SC58 TaxID=429131 RepID=A0A061J7S0_TRYRA|nr:hypothetical protein TRSC58_02145 [Trypanosoma rangeli SC58]
MKRLLHASIISVRGSLQCSRRYNLLEHKTKGSMFMKHLDLYARRDPQLAPYLLREVDIEYKRKCRKVSFCIWMCIFTVVTAFQIHMQGEQLHYLRLYADCVRTEQDAKDENEIRRRKTFVSVANIVRDAFDRDQTWSNRDHEKALKLL